MLFHAYSAHQLASWPRLLIRDPLASLQSKGSRTPAHCTFGAVPATPITLSLIEIHGYLMLRGRALVLLLLVKTILSAADTVSIVEGFFFLATPNAEAKRRALRKDKLAKQVVQN